MMRHILWIRDDGWYSSNNYSKRVAEDNRWIGVTNGCGALMSIEVRYISWMKTNLHDKSVISIRRDFSC